MIRHAFLIAVALSVSACGRGKAEKVAAKGADPKPFTLACTGQITDEMDRTRGTLAFTLTIDAANTEALITSIASDRAEELPPSLQNRNGDIVKVTLNDRQIVSDLNNSARQETGNKVTIDRRTGKFTGPDSNGSCAKAALVAMPGQKF